MRQAVEADPEQPEYIALQAWIQAQRMSDDLPADADARSTYLARQLNLLNRVLEREPDFERALYYRGEILKRAGFHAKAIRDFRKCIRLNPHNIAAAREVRLHDKRNKKDGGGILGRLFGGKKDS